MKIKIEEKQENPLLNRQDISFLVDHSGEATPPRNDVRAKLAAMLNCKEDQLFIVKFNGLYGQSITRGFAHLYPSKEVAFSSEQKYVLKRHATEEEATPPAMEIPEPASKEEPTPQEEKPEPKTEKPAKEKAPEKPPEKEAPKKEKKKEEPKTAPTKEATPPKEKPKPKKKKAEKPSEEKKAS